jgi:hypothetical protein
MALNFPDSPVLNQYYVTAGGAGGFGIVIISYPTA